MPNSNLEFVFAVYRQMNQIVNMSPSIAINDPHIARVRSRDIRNIFIIRICSWGNPLTWTKPNCSSKSMKTHKKNARRWYSVRLSVRVYIGIINAMQSYKIDCPDRILRNFSKWIICVYSRGKTCFIIYYILNAYVCVRAIVWCETGVLSIFPYIICSIYSIMYIKLIQEGCLIYVYIIHFDIRDVALLDFISSNILLFLTPNSIKEMHVMLKINLMN